MEFLEHRRRCDRCPARRDDPDRQLRSLIAWLVRRSKVTLARPDGHPRTVNLHFELVDLAVQSGWRKANQVLAAQFLRHARERRRQVLRLLQLEVAATGFI